MSKTDGGGNRGGKRGREGQPRSDRVGRGAGRGARDGEEGEGEEGGGAERAAARPGVGAGGGGAALGPAARRSPGPRRVAHLGRPARAHPLVLQRNQGPLPPT